MATEFPPEFEAAKNEWLEKFTSADDTIHRRFRERCDHYWNLYRSYDEFAGSIRGASPRDRDMGLRQAKRQFGSELFIPYAFSTVETIVPRQLSNRPKMLVLPRQPEYEKAAKAQGALVDWQQQNVRYEMVCQTTAKTGQIFGLGWQKQRWRHETRDRPYLKKSTLGVNPQTGEPMPYVVGVETGYCEFDDPWAEDCDPYDVIWDPVADSVENCGWIIHRTWRSTEYVLGKVRAGEWGAEIGLTEEDVDSSGSPEKFTDIWRQRQKAQGYGDYDVRGSQLHEVWECHNRSYVCTLLDREFPVRLQQNPNWHGELPFQAYRPVEVPHQMIGIGAIEPIEHLQLEMNTLRSQRRDNATLKLMQSYAYEDGAVDPNDILFGPGTMVPVNGPPNDLLQPLTVGDIPHSSYREEEQLKGDIERVTGIDDSLSGAGAAAQTATGVQMVQAAANIRIQNMTTRLEREVIAPAASQWIKLNQQRIRENRTIPIPRPPMPGQPERRWAWLAVSPEELQGEFYVIPEGGATAPENTPQKRQDGAQKMQLFGQNPQVDQRKLLASALEDFGFERPEQYLAPEEPRVPPQTMEILYQQLQETGMEGDVARQFLEQALAQAQQMEQQQQAQQMGPGSMEV